ncbi:carboxylic ester hydrolase [Marivirga lumbricoides]|uniref:Carboxylic ester hydrolase n=2 Tax=Marivirga lumbricoides TaxID=1046115 RepID=A0ABQ1LV40_9BACT|nr:carboxylic ester hydrolase [Marivirga lumbricoides]
MHLLFEGLRWQMFPAYVLLFVLAWRIKVVDASQPARLNFWRGSGYFVFVLVAVIAWVLPIALPVFTLPEPRGNYKVGTQILHVKTDKAEEITKDPNDKREFLCKIWYPSQADVSNLAGESYLDQTGREGFATKYGLPANALNYLDYVDTYVYPKIPVAEGKFPVLLFSHGYGSNATGYYALLTEIASQGYIIINMNHTYESLGATFPDGSKKYFDYQFQQEVTDWNAELMDPMIKAFEEGVEFEKRHQIARPAIKDYYEKNIQARWADDIVDVLDLLDQWNGEGFLKNKLNLDKIGVFGHSVGGGTAGRVAMQDSRIKAAANLDGIQWGKKIDTVYHLPFLFISADWPAEHMDINSHVYLKKSSDYFYDARLLNSGHPNFMDIPFLVTINAVNQSGDIDPALGTEITTKLVTAFFNRHLKSSADTDMEGIANEYDLLEMKVYKGDSIQ